MAKRKLGLSIIVLIVAATTMVSGTYAWFLVGGFAELFDLGFDVIEASGGIELQGSAGHAHAGAEDGAAQVEWGAYLQRDCFAAGELIVVDEIKLDAFKTAEMAKMLTALGCVKEVVVRYKDAETLKVFEETKKRTYKERTAKAAQSALIVLPEVDKFVIKSCSNIAKATTTLFSTLNVYEVLKAEKVIMTKAAIEKLQEVYA